MGRHIEQFLRKLEGRVIEDMRRDYLKGELLRTWGEDFLGDFGIDSGGDPQGRNSSILFPTLSSVPRKALNISKPVNEHSLSGDQSWPMTWVRKYQKVGGSDYELWGDVGFYCLSTCSFALHAEILRASPDASISTFFKGSALHSRADVSWGICGNKIRCQWAQLHEALFWG